MFKEGGRDRFVHPPTPTPTPVFTHYKHSTGIQIPVPNIYFSLLLRPKDLDFQLRNSLTRSLYGMPNSHDPLPTPPSPTPPNPTPLSRFHLQQAQYWDLNTRSKY